MQDLVERVNNSKKKISELIQHVDLDSRKNELAAAQKESENPNLWDEPEKAQKLMKKINDLQAEINSWDLLSKKADDVMELSEMELAQFCVDLPRYKRPRKIIFAPVIRNATGKIDKPKLREIYCGVRLVEKQNNS